MSDTLRAKAEAAMHAASLEIQATATEYAAHGNPDDPDEDAIRTAAIEAALQQVALECARIADAKEKHHEAEAESWLKRHDSEMAHGEQEASFAAGEIADAIRTHYGLGNA